MRDIVDFLFRKPRNCLIMSLLEDQGSLENAVNVSYEEHELQDTVDAFRKTKMYDPSGKNRFDFFFLRIRESSRNRVIHCIIYQKIQNMPQIFGSCFPKIPSDLKQKTHIQFRNMFERSMNSVRCSGKSMEIPEIIGFSGKSGKWHKL